jgi:hypothetical protein
VAVDALCGAPRQLPFQAQQQLNLCPAEKSICHCGDGNIVNTGDIPEEQTLRTENEVLPLAFGQRLQCPLQRGAFLPADK